MKKLSYILLLILFAVTSCIDDSTTGASVNLNEIKIEGIKDYYTAYSFIGERLVIDPNITSGYAENELTYKWYIYDKEKEGNAYGDMTPYEATLIGEEKKLDYEVRLQSGQYTLVLQVYANDGIMKSFETTVDISTKISRGFYILKETTDGNTEVDLYNPTVGDVEGIFIENMFTENLGKPMDGAPRHLDVCYGQGFLDPEMLAQGEEQTSSGITFCVTTEKDSVKFIRSSDFTEIFSNNTCFYEPPTVNVKPYRAVRGYFEIYYLTDQGIYATYAGDAVMGGSRGQFGKSVDTGGSTHTVTSADAFNSLVYWNETSSWFGMCDFNGFYVPVASEVEGYSDDDEMPFDCIACGSNKLGTNPETVVFVMQEKTDPSKRYLFYLACDMSGATLTKVVPLEEDSKLAQASCFAMNLTQASVIYGITDNKMYAYDLNGNTAEMEVPLQGIPADETITYLSNQYWKEASEEMYNFDYLLVGTQKGDTYKLYAYRLIGEQTDGAPVFSASGIGRLEGVHYVSPIWMGSPAVYAVVDR